MEGIETLELADQVTGQFKKWNISLKTKVTLAGAVGQEWGRWCSGKCLTPSFLEKERSWFVVFADAYEINTPKVADFKLQCEVNWLTKFLRSWHLALTSCCKPDPAHHWQHTGWHELFCFVFVLHDGILHCKWKCFSLRHNLMAQSLGDIWILETQGSVWHFGSFTLPVSFAGSDILSMYWWMQGLCEFCGSWKGSQDRSGWHPELCASVASDSLCYILPL